MEIFKQFSFEAAHKLPNVGSQHKCARLHGHSFRVEIYLAGAVDPKFGWVTDFADISSSMRPILELLDHSYLNEIDGLDNPTSEVLAVWIWNRLGDALPNLTQVRIRETCTSGCIYRGPSGDPS